MCCLDDAVMLLLLIERERAIDIFLVPPLLTHATQLKGVQSKDNAKQSGYDERVCESVRESERKEGRSVSRKTSMECVHGNKRMEAPNGRATCCSPANGRVFKIAHKTDLLG